MVQETARRLAGRGAVVQVNTEENPRLAQRFGIRGIPAFFLLRRGESIASISGGRDAGTLEKWFESHTS